MKAVTIYQPWASLIAVGAKQFETRSRATKYRGPIAIHAGRIPVKRTFFDNVINSITMPEFCKALEQHLPNLTELPLGAVIATAELVDCWRIVYHPGPDVDVASHIPIGGELEETRGNRKHPRFGEIIVPTETEMLFGDWTPGRYAWQLANVQMLETPIPARGRQGLWDWDGEVA
jgi:hypothetical protein